MVGMMNILSVAIRLLGLGRGEERIAHHIYRKCGCSVSDLERELKVSRRTVYKNLTKLVKAGIVRRVPSEINGRLAYVYHPLSSGELADLIRSALDKVVGREKDVNSRTG
jgi:predicted transcriptional regulator